jgi:hypothetical protein
MRALEVLPVSPSVAKASLSDIVHELGIATVQCSHVHSRTYRGWCGHQ